MSHSGISVPDGMVFALAVDSTPVRVVDAMEAVGINVDREDRHCEWANTAEMRIVCDQDVQFTITNDAYPDPASAVYTTIPATERYPINVSDAHEKVWFKATVAGTLTVELYGAQTPFCPI